MTVTYSQIATNTLGSTTATVTFSSIPGTYTDLVLVIAAKNPNPAVEIEGTFNSDTGTNYSFTQLQGNGTTATSARVSNRTAMRFGFCNNDNASNSIIHIMNYANTTTNKTVINRINNQPYNLFAVVNLWRSTAAITSITLAIESGGSFSSGSTFSLYGIKAE